MILVMVTVSTITFFISHSLPGDPVALWVGDHPTKEQLEMAKKNLGLDRPIHEQYVSFLRNKGLNKIAEKLGEEATETIVAAVTSKRNQTISESADLIFVLMVLLAEMKISPEEVFEELIKREGISGHVEKLQRN